MRAGERALLRPSGSPLVLGVTLRGFTPPTEPFWATPSPQNHWASSVASWASRAQALLASGTGSMAWTSAVARAHSRALRAMVVSGGPPPLPDDLAGTKADLHAGLALAQLRLGLPAAAAANAGKALALRPGHLEARYRRAVAAAAMRDLEGAMADLGLVLRAQPGHRGARREMRRVRGAARERDARLARRLGRLFA
ncbi:FKBPL protein, partial [Xiphorhynchus elegans]|nr:FKBPL protein [Xiphorhynchus elegans]